MLLEILRLVLVVLVILFRWFLHGRGLEVRLRKVIHIRAGLLLSEPKVVILLEAAVLSKEPSFLVASIAVFLAEGFTLALFLNSTGKGYVVE